jgi:hypothetical protein
VGFRVDPLENGEILVIRGTLDVSVLSVTDVQAAP